MTESGNIDSKRTRNSGRDGPQNRGVGVSATVETCPDSEGRRQSNSDFQFSHPGQSVLRIAQRPLSEIIRHEF